jgi:hypothetical protein
MGGSRTVTGDRQDEPQASHLILPESKKKKKKKKAKTKTNKQYSLRL